MADEQLIERFDMSVDNSPQAQICGSVRAVPYKSPSGSWVRWEDVAKLEEELRLLDQYDADLKAAAGELLVPLPEPGTDAARMLLANRKLHRENDRLRENFAELRRMADEKERDDTVEPTPSDDGKANVARMIAEALGVLDHLWEARDAWMQDARAAQALAEKRWRLDHEEPAPTGVPLEMGGFHEGEFYAWGPHCVGDAQLVGPKNQNTHWRLWTEEG